MKFEVQLRTAVQHAWATAVEVYDSTARARFKFTSSENPAYEQFLIISEIFARVYEGRKGCLPDLSDTELLLRQSALERETHMLSTIDSLVVAENYGRLEQNSILQRTRSGDLFVHRFSSLPAAIRSIAKIEDLDETENAVLVGATTPSHIRVAFRNYFDDTKDFVQLLVEATDKLGS